jgi:hypothetical protein
VSLGDYDPELLPSAWFDELLVNEAWWDESLVDSGTTATLTYALDGVPEPLATNGTLTFTLSAIVGGTAQTTLSVTVTLTWSAGGTRPAAPTDGALDSWTSGTWTASGGDAWTNTYTRASQSVGTTAPVFTVSTGTTAGTLTSTVNGSSTEVASPTETGDVIDVFDPHVPLLMMGCG